VTFRKRGRPREDRVARRLEIFEFVAPSLAQLGHRISMREAARAAHVSVGTLYSYFGSKRDLLLYGLNQEPVALICRRFELEHGQLRTTDPRRYREALLDFMMTNIVAMRASVDTAIRLGPKETRERIDRVIHQPIPEFVRLIADAMPEDRGRSVAAERLLRRVIAGVLLERDVSAEALREQLHDILEPPAR